MSKVDLPSDDDALAELLDQPSRQDPFHPHMLVKPSADVPGDLEQLKAAIERMAALHRGGRKVTPSQADQWKHACSALIAKLGNSISGTDDKPR